MIEQGLGIRAENRYHIRVGGAVEGRIELGCSPCLQGGCAGKDGHGAGKGQDEGNRFFLEHIIPPFEPNLHGIAPVRLDHMVFRRFFGNFSERYSLRRFRMILI